MTTDTSSLMPYAPVNLAPRKDSHFFLRALEHIQYGRMFLTTPEGSVLEFSGNEEGPIAHLHLHDWNALDELVGRGEIGFAEAYIHRQWDTPDLPALLTFGLVNTDALEDFFHGKPLYALWLRLKNIFRRNSVQGSRRNITKHYDLGNEFYALWLDKGMTYSCGLFEQQPQLTLEEAQQRKYQRILYKIAAKPGEHILEIGCGWGGFAIAAANAGLQVTALTISEKQADYARQRIAQQGLSHRISVQLKDYRTIEGMFDHIVSIGMFEHVGEEYWPAYFRTIKQHLKPGGRALVQSITLQDRLFEKLHGVTGFIEEYIFPGGLLPSKTRFCSSALKAGLMCREIFTFGDDYVLTLHRWLSRFEARKREVMALGYDESFLRLWKFYLSSCIASFASRRTDVMQAEIMHAL